MNIEDSLPLGKETGLGSPNQLGTYCHNMGDRLRNLAVSQIHRSNTFYFNKRFKRFFTYKNFKQKQGWYERLVGCCLLSVVVSILRVCFFFPSSPLQHLLLLVSEEANLEILWFYSSQMYGRTFHDVFEWVREIWIGEGATITGSKLANNRKHSVRHKKRSC